MAAADQRAVHRKVGVLRGGPNQDNRAILYMRQEGILLGLIKAMHFIDKEDSPLLHDLLALAGIGDGLADICNASEDGIDRDKMAACGIGNDHRQGCFSRSWWPTENERRELISFNRPTQESTRPEDVFLANKLPQRARSHTCRQGFERREKWHPGAPFPCHGPRRSHAAGSKMGYIYSSE